jgi:hypothetical protein
VSLQGHSVIKGIYEKTAGYFRYLMACAQFPNLPRALLHTNYQGSMTPYLSTVHLESDVVVKVDS